MPISPYIRQLRAHIDPARLLLPSVSVHVFDPRGALLLVRQADGGVIEPDERAGFALRTWAPPSWPPGGAEDTAR